MKYHLTMREIRFIVRLRSFNASAKCNEVHGVQSAPSNSFRVFDVSRCVMFRACLERGQCRFAAEIHARLQQIISL